MVALFYDRLTVAISLPIHISCLFLSLSLSLRVFVYIYTCIVFWSTLLTPLSMRLCTTSLFSLRSTPSSPLNLKGRKPGVDQNHHTRRRQRPQLQAPSGRPREQAIRASRRGTEPRYRGIEQGHRHGRSQGAINHRAYCLYTSHSLALRRGRDEQLLDCRCLELWHWRDMTTHGLLHVFFWGGGNRGQTASAAPSKVSCCPNR